MAEIKREYLDAILKSIEEVESDIGRKMTDEEKVIFTSGFAHGRKDDDNTSDDWKETIEYDIPIQGEEQVEKHNKMCKEMFGEQFTPLKSTEEHVDILIDKLYKAIDKVGDAGGWYVGDGIGIKIELTYDPEDK